MPDVDLSATEMNLSGSEIDVETLGSDTIIITATEEDLRILELLVKQLDAAKTPKRLEIVLLEKRDAAEVATRLQQAVNAMTDMGQDRRPEDHVDIFAFGSNILMISAPETRMEEIVRIAKALDAAPDMIPDKEPMVFQVKNRKAAEAATKLKEVIDRLRANRRIPEMPDFHDWRQRLTDLFENTETADYEELWNLSDGSDIRVLARPHPHGSLAFVFDDVTERMRLEQQYRHSIDLRRATLDRLDEGLAVFGPDGLLQLVNNAFHEIWGTDAETVRPSMHASELLPLVRGLTVETDVWSRLMNFITGAESRQAWGARLTLGTGRILAARFASLPDGSTMAAFTDVTDSERIALALRERNEALEAAEEMRAAVMDQISHRLRTPLNTIFGFGQLIADSRFGTLTDAQRGYADGILESARHLLATIDDVTELAALEINSLHDHGAELSLGDTLMLTGRLLEKRATEEGVELRIIAPQVGCEAACDAGRLRQIVFNMTTDAISRCCDGGKIELGARAGEDG
ncbi:MAG: PAS-domain containing protein, partial [Planctomycetes bacterium]|nr:PAS-domain containing protein [Planctomycetota bacterium]